MSDVGLDNDGREAILPDADDATFTPSAVFGPAYALLRAALGDRIPSGALGPETVPSAVLVLPIVLAIEDLVDHAKHCHHGVRCPVFPPSLLRYRRMRPDALRAAREDVHKVLWTQPSQDVVVRVRKAILATHDQLAEEICKGGLLKDDRLREVLDELGADGPVILASVLWALEFDGPHSEALFRCIVPLAQERTSPTNKTLLQKEDRPRKSTAAEVRRLRREVRQANHTAEETERDLQVRQRALDKSRRELEVAQRELSETTAERDRLQAALRETDAALRDRERDAEQSQKVLSDLRRDLRRLQQSNRELEAQRSDLARQVSEERRELERLSLELSSVPSGADAVREFLRAEEKRIKNDRIILSGQPKADADKQWTAHGRLERAFFDAYPQYRQPPPVKLRRKTSLRFVALGGSGEVGRSCYLLELGAHRVLVDCGIKPSGSGSLPPEIDRLEGIDALILTHAHTDHIGWVPALVRQFGEFDIYCSEGTAALLPVMLGDCRRHYVRELAKKQNIARHVSNADAVTAEYDQEDVETVPSLTIGCPFGYEETLPFGDISLRFYRAGHVLGASSILIEDSSGRRIFFSGDFSSFPQLTVDAAAWPEELGEIDLFVSESTYGGREHKPLVDSRRELISFIRETTEGRHGSVILASFALGRAQELLSLIAEARKCGELSRAVPVHIDGMIKQINPIYHKYARFDVSEEFFNEVSGDAERKDVAFQAHTKPTIIVTTSGMITGGPVVEYARSLLPDARNRIVLTGYQDEGAPSKALRELSRFGGGPRVVEIEDESGDLVRFEAALPAKEFSLSSHADQPGIIEYPRRLRPKVIALVHGEPAGQEALASELSQIHPQAEIALGPSDLAVS